MRFKIWFEDMADAMVSAPASSEVIRTGLQPQVDAKEIKTKEKEAHDKIMALDGHVQRIRSVLETMPKTDDLQKIEQLCKHFVQKWDKIKNGEDSQVDVGGLAGTLTNQRQLDYMKRNQPLPESPRRAGPGTFGVDA